MLVQKDRAWQTQLIGSKYCAIRSKLGAKEGQKQAVREENRMEKRKKLKNYTHAYKGI